MKYSGFIRFSSDFYLKLKFMVFNPFTWGLIIMLTLSTGGYSQTTTPRPDRSPADFKTRSANARNKKELQENRKKSNLARRLESSGDYTTALQIYTELFNDDYSLNSTFNSLMRCYTALEDYNNGLSFINSILDQSNIDLDRTTLYLEAGNLHYLAKETNEAEKYWQKAINLNPQNRKVYSDLSRIFMRLRLVDRSIEVLKEARKTLNDPYFSANIIASIQQHRMEWKSSAQEYLLALRQNPNSKNLTIRSLANFPNEEMANQAVIQVVQDEIELSKKDKPWNGYTTVLEEILASQHMKNGDYASALKWVAKIDAKDSKPGLRLIEFAAQAFTEGADSVATQALNYASSHSSETEIQMGVDFTYMSIAVFQGNYLQADSILSIYCNDSVSANIEKEARLKRGMLRLEYLNDPARAIEDFEALLSNKKITGEETVRYAYSTALIKLDKLDEAIKQLELIRPAGKQKYIPGFDYNRSLKMQEENIFQARFLQSQITWWQNEPSNSLILLDDALSNIVGSSLENEAIALSHLLRSSKSDSLNLQLLAQADKADFCHEFVLADSRYKQVEAETKVKLLALDAAWRRTQMYFNNQLEGMVTVLEEFAAKYPDDIKTEEIYLALGELAELDQDFPRAVKYYEDLLIAFPDGLLNSEARLRLDNLAGIELPPLQPLLEDALWQEN